MPRGLCLNVRSKSTASFNYRCLTSPREWTRQRYGVVTALYLSFLTLATLFLYMIAELSALYQIMNALTGQDGLPMMIVEGAVTTIYTCKFIIPNLIFRIFPN